MIFFQSFTAKCGQCRVGKDLMLCVASTWWTVISRFQPNILFTVLCTASHNHRRKLFPHALLSTYAMVCLFGVRLSEKYKLAGLTAYAAEIISFLSRWSLNLATLCLLPWLLAEGGFGSRWAVTSFPVEAEYWSSSLKSLTNSDLQFSLVEAAGTAVPELITAYFQLCASMSSDFSSYFSNFLFSDPTSPSKLCIFMEFSWQVLMNSSFVLETTSINLNYKDLKHSMSAGKRALPTLEVAEACILSSESYFYS